MLSLLLAATTSGFFPQSPQRQALTIVDQGLKKSPVVVRVNTADRYASVLTRGGAMEGSSVDWPILFERFSFGWQALGGLDSRCTLESFKLNAETSAALLRGMPSLRDDRPCTRTNTFASDYGSAELIDAVRKLMRGPFVPYVVVSGDWALGEWYGAGGGEDLFRRRGTTWQLAADGGGAQGTEEMRKYGVPESDWCLFGIYNAKCPTPK